MAKKRAPKPRQQKLPGTEDSKIAPLESAAQEYAELRDQRMELNAEESKLKQKLLNLMKQHGNTTYKRAGIEIKLVTDEETVKVKIRKPKDDERDESVGDLE